MRKGKILLFLVLVITALFVVSCVKLPVIPGVPANLRATALIGVVGVELRWDAVAGAASYDVTITKQAASGSRETFGPYNTTNTYYLANRTALGAGDFDWTVSAKNVAGSSANAAGPEFNLPANPIPDPVYGLVLALEERPEMASSRSGVPTIYIYGDAATSGQRSCINQFNYLAGLLRYLEVGPLGEARDDMAVQFMVQEVGGGVAKRWPDSNTEFLLDDEGELVFYVNNLGANFNPELAEGEYYLWARAAWDNSIESTKERFDIVSLESALTSEIILMDEDENEYTDKVCPVSTEVTLIYDVSISGGELFDCLYYSFSITSAVDPTITATGTFNDATEFSKEVTYATECTKIATLTVNGTITSVSWDDEKATEVSESVYIPTVLVDGISFVLDMANPTGLVSVDPIAAVTAPASITTATLTFLASDTKCLQPYAEKIAFEVYVYKGAGNWSADFAYGVTETVLGEDSEWNNEITINGTYSATKTTTDNATITLVFDIQDLDLATITATMTVHDCCCEDCMLEGPCVGCGVGGNITHETEVMAAFVVDNVFFSSMLELDEIVELEGFLGEADATPTIPASPAQATLTVQFADANWTPSISAWSFYANGVLFEEITYAPLTPTPGTLLGECSGYATKTEATYVGTLTAIDDVATEVELTLIATAVDAVGNLFVFEHNFLFDTIPPTLTHFTAFRDQISNQSWIEFKFDQKAEEAELALTVTASGTFLYDLEDAEEIAGQENAYRLLTGITLPFGETITLEATATDLAGNIGFSTLNTEVSISSSR